MATYCWQWQHESLLGVARKTHNSGISKNSLSAFPNREMQHDGKECWNLDEITTTFCVIVEEQKGFARSTKN